MLWLTLAALIPAIALCIYIFCKDRVEKEPIGLLLLLFFCGVVSTPFAAELEGLIDGLLGLIFSPFGSVQGGVVVYTGFMHYLTTAVRCFFNIALVEEGLKWGILMIITRNNKNFNSVFDGIVYAVFVSLGFAAFENILYVFNGGWSVAAIRAFTAIPGHMFFAVIMGFYYSQWKVCSEADLLETKYQNTLLLKGQRIKKDYFNPTKSFLLSIGAPIFVHGFYDFCCMAGVVWASLLFYAFLIGLYVYCFKKVRQMSRQDTNLDEVALLAFKRMYPHLGSDQETIHPAGGETTVSAPSVPKAPAPTTAPRGDVKVYTFSSGDKYIGALKDGKMSGFGSYYFKNGGKYQGNFENGMFNGHGTYHDPQGGRYVGNWKNNQRHGNGTYYWKSGRIAKGIWEGGELVKKI